MQEPINQRLMEVYKELKKAGLVTSKTAFMEAIGQVKQHFNGFEDGSRKVHPKHISLLTNQFGVNSDYLITGQGPVFKEEPKTGGQYAYAGRDTVQGGRDVSVGTKGNEDCEQQLKAALIRIADLEARIQDKDELIALLRSK